MKLLPHAKRVAMVDVSLLAGLALIGVGVGLVYLPAALIVVGVLLLLGSLRLGGGA